MPVFQFAITHDVTMTAQVEIEAASIGEAQEIALGREFFQDPEKAKFVLDEGNTIRGVYLPDENDWTEVPSPAVPGA
jgi:hypothetical protein